MMLVAMSYMILNYLRFGSIWEFGHNYLPEFLRADKGQFHVDYIPSNILMLFNLPEVTEEGKLVISHYGNLNFMLASPIIIAAILGFIYVEMVNDRRLIKLSILTMALAGVYLVILLMHCTLGGWHFGNRYTIDILPYIFALVCLISEKYPKLIKYDIPLMVFGCILNVVGTIVVYNEV